MTIKRGLHKGIYFGWFVCDQADEAYNAGAWVFGWRAACNIPLHIYPNENVNSTNMNALEGRIFSSD